MVDVYLEQVTHILKESMSLMICIVYKFICSPWYENEAGKFTFRWVVTFALTKTNILSKEPALEATKKRVPGTAFPFYHGLLVSLAIFLCILQNEYICYTCSYFKLLYFFQECNYYQP